MDYRLLISFILLFSLVILCLLLLFIKDLNTAKKRFKKYFDKSKTIKTSFGNLSYIDEGEGEAIISCHGICGGYDQGYDTLSKKTNKYRVIAPSRFGYPGSDMPDNATIDLQATAYKELLDQLQIEKAYILCTSAGATSAIKFTLMYPERTKGLILYCSGYPKMEAPKKKQKLAGPPSIMCNDFVMWMMSPLFKPIMGMDKEIIHLIMPLKTRKKGIIFDGKITNTEMNNNYMEYDMSKIEVPVLMIHSKDDKLAPFKEVEPWAKRIKNCSCTFFEKGGHLMANNGKEIDDSFEKFIKTNE